MSKDFNISILLNKNCFYFAYYLLQYVLFLKFPFFNALGKGDS